MSDNSPPTTSPQYTVSPELNIAFSVRDSNLGLKKGVKNDIFWSEIGSGFGELGGTPPPRIPRSNPPPLLPG